MNTRKYILNNLHIFIILIIIFCLSVLTWIEFSGNADDLLANLSKRTEKPESLVSEVTDAEDISTIISKPNKTDSFIHLADTTINEINSMWDESFFQKSRFGRVDSLFSYLTIRDISSTQVVLGKENWLFYKSIDDGNSIEDYTGTNKFSESELNHMLESTLRVQNKITSKDIQFAIILAPNKEHIYSEFMPDIYSHTEKSRTDCLAQYLRNNGVNVISPKDELINYHSDYQLYYKYDTHWNQLGAYIGVREILATWGISLPSLEEQSIQVSALKDNYHYCARDDLAKMVGLLSIFNDEKEYVISGTQVDWPAFDSDQSNGIISHFNNKNAPVQKTLLLVGDSFRSAMVPILQQVFSDLYVTHRGDYTPDIIDDISPDYLIAEYVERYSGSIKAIDFMIN